MKEIMFDLIFKLNWKSLNQKIISPNLSIEILINKMNCILKMSKNIVNKLWQLYDVKFN